MSHLATFHAGNGSFFLSLTILIICSLSCNNPDDTISAVQSFKASAFIEVVDLDGQPVSDAVVSIVHQENNLPVEKKYGMTDKRGILALHKVDMFSSTYLTVTREGYFTGSRRFYTSAGKTQIIHITLLEEKYAGYFNSAEGGQFNVQSKVSITFPPYSIASENGQPYDGVVNVYAEPIAADDKDLSQKMPGSLEGINIYGQQGVLGSFGMAAVTLRSLSGERLQIMNGLTVEMKMKVPSSLLAVAPQTIAMWYFDENTGYWKEDGSAALIGSEYIAQLSHFTFWNCDAWFEIVKWGASFTYENGDPASMVEVCITIERLGLQKCGYTDNVGFIQGAVAANENLLVEVKPPKCTAASFRKEYGPYSDSIVIGNIIVPEPNYHHSTLHGKGLQCSGKPITNGYVITRVHDYTRFDFLEIGTGAFNISFIDCDQSDIHVFIYDLTSNKESHPVVLEYKENLNAGTLVACEELNQFIKVSAAGLVNNYYFLFPRAFLDQTGETILLSGDSLTSYAFYAPIQVTEPGTYSNESFYFSFVLENGHRVTSSNATLNLTYFGGLHDYISGTFTGNLFEEIDPGQSGKEYPFNGEFNLLIQEW
jgi:hypothetical protein